MSNEPLVVAAHPRFIDNAPLVVASLLVVDSLHFIFARLLLPYLSPATSVLYVLAIATAEVAVVVVLNNLPISSIFYISVTVEDNYEISSFWSYWLASIGS